MMKYVLAVWLIALSSGITEKEFMPEEKMIEHDIEIIEDDIHLVEQDIEKHSGDKKRGNVFDMIGGDINRFISDIKSVTDEELGIRCGETATGSRECGWAGCSFGYAQEDTGLSGEVLRQITTRSLSNPEWMDGRSFDQNIELCKTECIKRESCVGLQFSPTFWDHEECFLMDGVGTYTRPSWQTIVKDISTCETTRDIKMIMEMVKTDFCTGADDTKNEKSLLGSSCKKSFNFMSSDTTDACARLPCNVISHVNDEMPTRLGMLKHVESVQDYVQWLMDTLKPISPGLLCNCNKSFSRSVIGCATSYDGMLVHNEDMEFIWSTLRMLPNMVSMQPLEDGLTGLLSAYCGDESAAGESATGAYMRAIGLHEIVVTVAEMVDNSIQDKKSNADNLRRMSDKIYEMVGALQASAGLDDAVKAITILPNAFWFEDAKKIAKRMQERITGKCAFWGFLNGINSQSDYSNSTTIELLLQFASSITRLLQMGEASDQTTLNLSRSLNPLTSCQYQLGECKPGKKESKCAKIQKKIQKKIQRRYKNPGKRCEK